MSLCSSGEHGQEGWVTTLGVSGGMEGGGLCWGPQVTSRVAFVSLGLSNLVHFSYKWG